MNIKHIARTAVLGLALLIPATQANQHVPQDFDSYINAALVVYSNHIPPSIQTSEQFYNYLEARWHFLQCRSTPECSRLGSSVAWEFASMRQSS